MALFDGGRMDRIRNFNAGGRHNGKRYHVGGELNMHELQLPFIKLSFEECALEISIGFGGYWNDKLVNLYAGVELPGVVADLLAKVLPE
jgi:hypothetical protein